MRSGHNQRIGRFLLACVLAVTIAQEKQARPSSPASKNRSDVSAKLELARAYREMELLDEAKGEVRGILVADPKNGEARRELLEILNAEKTLAEARDGIQLDIAEWYLWNGKPEEGIELIQSVIKSTKTLSIVERGRNILSSVQDGWRTQVWQKLSHPSSWLIDLFHAFALIPLLWLLLLGLRESWTWVMLSASWISAVWSSFRRKGGRGPTWRVRAIDDQTPLGISSLIMTEFSRLHAMPLAPPVSAGLLKLEALALPSPAIVFEGIHPRVNLTDVAQSLQLKIGGAEVGSIARFFAVLVGWFKARLPTVSGLAIVSRETGERVTVRLTAQSEAHRIASVSASAVCTTLFDAARVSTEEAAFKMYYLLGRRNATEQEAEAVNDFREGLNLLHQYVKGEHDRKKLLQEALDKFQVFRNARPDFLEAFLYEGVALDLLERHDEALLRFQYVRERAPEGGELHEKALYNEAVANMRKYCAGAERQAVSLFDQVIGDAPDVLGRPVKVLAKAGKANAIAHYPIFWQTLIHGRRADDDQECMRWKIVDRQQVNRWIREVEALVRELEADLQQVKNPPKRAGKSKWHPTAVWQLEWALSSAIGNAHLNFATGLLEPPRPREFSDAEEEQKEQLEKALAAFQKCEMLLPPGVETLTNMMTVLLFLGRYNESRTYGHRAIELNPAYEYAYYRIVHAWDRENRPVEAKAELEKSERELKRQGKQVHIREFRDLFAKYGVPLPA